MDEIPEAILLEDNYYQLLNISKTATIDEINSAYRKFSRIFHPDKHSLDPARQKLAEQIFNKVKNAYEILSDPHRRAIYDTLGKRGLEIDGWEIIVRNRTPREIRDEYERLKREREERRLQQSTNPRGTITLSINATDLFTNYYDEYENLESTNSFPIVEVSGMTIYQSIDAPITIKDTATLSGNISTQNGIGSGSVNICNRRITSEKGWCETEFGIGNGPAFGFKGFRTMSKTLFLSGGSSLQFSSRGIKPSFYSTLAYQLDRHSVGYLTYRAGNSQGSSLTTTYARDSEFYHTNVSVQFGTNASFISINLMKKMVDMELKARMSFKLGTFGAIAEYGAEKKISQHTSISAAVMVGIPTGVILKLKWTRTSQTIVIPIHLCEEIAPAPVFYATIIPIVTWLVVKKLIIDPIKKEKEDREKEKSREANRDRILELQREARATIELMRETYSRIRADEEKKDGLVIIDAVYGKLPDGASHHEQALSGDSSPTDDQTSRSCSMVEAIDVTIPLQCLVRDSRLQLLEASKSELPGFYDPCIGDEKHLTIRYIFHGQQHLCTIGNRDAVILPRQVHRVDVKS